MWMRIEVRENMKRLGRATPDPAARPTRARTDRGREIFLNWDGALDDSGRLRKCLVCGCSELFQEKAFPQVTSIVVVLAFAGAAAGVFGLVTNIPVLIAMTIVLAVDVGILLFSKRRLVCYRCRSSFHDLEIARYHRPWDRSIADRYEQSGRPGSAAAEAADARSIRAGGFIA